MMDSTRHEEIDNSLRRRTLNVFGAISTRDYWVITDNPAPGIAGIQIRRLANLRRRNLHTFHPHVPGF